MFSVSQDKDVALVVLTRCGKLYVGGRRLHHGLTGEVVLLAGLALHRRWLAAAGAVLIAHDRRDFPFPLTDPKGWGPKQLGTGGHR